jgi:hypothetical protein
MAAWLTAGSMTAWLLCHGITEAEVRATTPPAKATIAMQAATERLTHSVPSSLLLLCRRATTAPMYPPWPPLLFLTADSQHEE